MELDDRDDQLGDQVLVGIVGRVRDQLSDPAVEILGLRGHGSIT
jgi:hypothetical protein